MMVWTDRVTEMVVGRRLADQLDRARLEKMYEGAEQRLKQTTYVACEPRLEAPNHESRGYMFQRTESVPLELPQQGTLRPRRQKLQRSQSEIVDTTKSATTSPSGPPDITAIDLSDDQIRRAYSQADVRRQKPFHMPPLEQMTGFGKYRRSIHADPEWQMQHYRANLRDLPRLVPQLGDFKLADPDPLVWEQFCQESARSDSFASSKTSHSDSSECLTDGAKNRRQGPVITRGFAPSASSSAASSFRDSSSSHVRKDSAMSMTSPSGDSDNKLVRFSSRQSTLSLLCESTALTAINEDLAGDQRQRCKESQFLECALKGGVENALESDYEDAIEGSPIQLDGTKSGVHDNDPLTSKPSSVQNKNPTQRVKGERVNGRDLCLTKPQDSKRGLNRSTTIIRKPVKPALRQTMSRGKPQCSRRVSILDNPPITGKRIDFTSPEPQVHINYAISSSDEATDRHITLCDSGLYMAGARNSTISKVQGKDDSNGPLLSNPTLRTVTTETKSNLPTKTARLPRRNRSGTAIRIVSGTTQA